MGNQNTAVRYGDTFESKQHVNVIGQRLPKVIFKDEKHFSGSRTIAKKSIDIDSYWGPDDLKIEHESDISAQKTHTANDDVRSLLPEEIVSTDHSDPEYEDILPQTAADEEEIEERYANDEDFDEIETLESDSEKLNEEVLRLSLDAITWDWYNGLPEDAETIEEEDNDLVLETHITKEKRNHQHAYMLAFEYGWTEQADVEVLVEILEPSGRASNTIAQLRELMDKGVSAEELKLAYQIREQWKERQEFSKHFIAAWDRYHTYTITWDDAFKLVRIYSGTPDIEEIFIFLEKLHDKWSNESPLNSSQSFQLYLSEFLESGLPTSCPDLYLDTYDYGDIEDIKFDLNLILNEE